jgi:hypothetical protein
MSTLSKTPLTEDVEMAKKAVYWDDKVDDGVANQFPSDNDPSKFHGDRKDLSAIRSAMKRYEEQEAGIMEDKEYYEARFRLQFVEVGE